MKRLALLICCFTLSYCLFADRQQHLISGTIKGFGSDTVVVFCISLSDASTRSVDTILAKNDQFFFNRTISEISECAIYSSGCYIKRLNGRKYLPETRIIKFILFPNNKVTILGTLGQNSLDYQIRGNSFNEKYSQRRSVGLKSRAEFVKRELLIDSMAYRKVDSKLLDRLDKELSQEKLHAQFSDITYLVENPDMELSAYYLSGMPQDTFLKYIGFLKPIARNGIFKYKLDMLEGNYRSIKAIQDAQKLVVEGTVAPDFTLKSMDSTSVKLSDFKGKYVVLDFWGSWCHWCLNGLPKMKKYYEKYREKVVFIGVDVRDTEKVWKEFVQKNQMDWIQLRNLTDTDLPSIYGVSGYPTKFILDPEQRIVERIVGENPAFYEKLDKILQ